MAIPTTGPITPLTGVAIMILSIPMDGVDPGDIPITDSDIIPIMVDPTGPDTITAGIPDTITVPVVITPNQDIVTAI